MVYYRAEENNNVRYRRHAAVIVVRAVAYSSCASAFILQTARTVQGEPLSMKLFSPLIAAALLGGIWLFERLSRLRLPAYLDAALCVFICGGLTYGSTYDFYNIVPGWDKILHSMSGFLFYFVGLCLADLLAGKEMPGKRRAVTAAVTALAISLSIGYLWELFEYAGDSLLGMDNQRWQAGIIGETGDGNYITNTPQGSAIIDTMTDMLCHFAGSLLCFIATICAFVKKPSRMDVFVLTCVKD